MEKPRSLEEVNAILPEFKASYANRPSIVTVGLGVELTRRGSHRYVFRAYLGTEPTPDQQEAFKKTFRHVPIRYETVTADEISRYKQTIQEVAQTPHVQTMEELEQAVGGFSEEERQLIDDVEDAVLNAPPPTPEELAKSRSSLTRVFDNFLRLRAFGF